MYVQRVCEVEHGIFTPVPLFFQQQVVKLQHFIRYWQMESPGRNKMNILLSWDGFAVAYLLQSSNPSFSAFVEADPPTTTQYMN